MLSILHRLPRATLEQLGTALAAGRLQPPYQGFNLRECISDCDHAAVGVALEKLRATGLTGPQLGLVLDLLANERAIQQQLTDRLQMVWSGPDREGPAARDTGVVVRELLGQAKSSLLVATFSVSRGTTIFEPLKEAMDRWPKLDVTLVLHIDLSQRGLFGEAAVAEFAREFWKYQWPWPARPNVYFDPRGVLQVNGDRANQHAKCIVADNERVLITSANFTEWAQERNIELGVVIRDELLAQRVVDKFRGLIASGLLQRLRG